MHLFGMITTSASSAYTAPALRSLLAHTPAALIAGIVLIDNDGDYVLPPDIAADRVTIIRQPQPHSFARNANLLLGQARDQGVDLFLLNNDLVFTPGWVEPLLTNRRAILSPLSNADVAHRVGGFVTRPVMALADYLGHDAALARIARDHAATHAGYETVGAVAFFCVRIPKSVYDVVGEFDEHFGRGGGEDRDYAVRAWIAGIPLEIARASYVLHFQGRSTWRGPETAPARREREAAYISAFEAKWGPALTHAFIHDRWNLFRSDPRLGGCLQRRDYASIVRQLRSRPSVERFVTRQRTARFGAVCCLYEDDSWLVPAVESAYDACDTIWFLVGYAPWNGDATDQAAVLERLAAIPDPAGKFRIIRGTWPDEATQRNDGLQLVAAAGLEYCFVLDADEIYDSAQLRRAMAIARENPQVDCWRISCVTYWKSHRFRVDPPERVPAVVFVRIGTGRFVANRTCDAPRQMPFPADVVVFHHMSYARTDAQILRKITTFGHAGDVVPGWFEKVWQRWDVDPSIENLNPCWPAAYRRIVEQSHAALPEVIQRRWPEPRAE